jgi:hypothetical protein
LTRNQGPERSHGHTGDAIKKKSTWKPGPLAGTFEVNGHFSRMFPERSVAAMPS